jgi:hypothetical protein
VDIKEIIEQDKGNKKTGREDKGDKEMIHQNKTMKTVKEEEDC